MLGSLLVTARLSVRWAQVKPNLLLEQATLAEGGTLEDPAGFVKRTNDLMLALSAGK